ncbi:hypothetical protein TPY_2659 [Sulfobacillus acidophilus TPY]|nr:hypothetical protein TPY_2659 [Sulfobacillus acidophilus TPY]
MRAASVLALVSTSFAGMLAAPAVQASTPVVTLQASATTSQPGGAITLTASAPGVSQAQYQFWLQNPQGQWSSTPYIGSNHWTFTPSQPGTYHVMVYVLSQANVWAHRWSQALHPTSPATVTVQNPTVTLQPSTTNSPAGQAITLTLNNPGIAQAQYQFWIRYPNGQWTDTPYLSTNQWTFTPSQAGTYLAMGYVLSRPNVLAHNWSAALHPATPVTLTIHNPTIFDQFQAQNQQFLNQSVYYERKALPWLSVTIANDDTLGISDFNNPIVLNQYHVPLLPVSLAAAGIATSAFPANNAIVGETPALVTQWTQEAQAIPGSASLTSSQVLQAVTTAVQANLLGDGNGNGAIFLANPDSPTVSGIRNAELQQEQKNPTDAVTALIGPQGWFAQRNYVYQEWADVSQVTISAPPAVDPYPAGHVVTTLQVNNIVVNLIMGGIYQGHEIIGVYPAPPVNVSVDLIQDNGQERWYISWGTYGNTGNPTQVLWTGPAIQ